MNNQTSNKFTSKFNIFNKRSNECKEYLCRCFTFLRQPRGLEQEEEGFGPGVEQLDAGEGDNAVCAGQIQVVREVERTTEDLCATAQTATLAAARRPAEALRRGAGEHALPGGTERSARGKLGEVNLDVNRGGRVVAVDLSRSEESGGGGADVGDVLLEQRDADVRRAATQRMQAELDVNVTDAAWLGQDQLKHMLLTTCTVNQSISQSVC